MHRGSTKSLGGRFGSRLLVVVESYDDTSAYVTWNVLLMYLAYKGLEYRDGTRPMTNHASS